MMMIERGRTERRLARDERKLSSVWFRAFFHQSRGVSHELLQRRDGDVGDFHYLMVVVFVGAFLFIVWRERERIGLSFQFWTTLLKDPSKTHRKKSSKIIQCITR